MRNWIDWLNTVLKQKFIFFGKVEEDNKATMFFIIEKSKEATFNFSKNSVYIIENGYTKWFKFVEEFKQRRT